MISSSGLHILVHTCVHVSTYIDAPHTHFRGATQVNIEENGNVAKHLAVYMETPADHYPDLDLVLY